MLLKKRSLGQMYAKKRRKVAYHEMTFSEMNYQLSTVFTNESLPVSGVTQITLSISDFEKRTLATCLTPPINIDNNGN